MSADLHDVAVELVPTLKGAAATTGNVPDLMDALRRAEEDARARYEDDLETALLKWLDSLNLDPDDKQTCVTELVEALHSPDPQGAFLRAVKDWTITARELSDPDRREVLLSPLDPADMVPVTRPG